MKLELILFGGFAFYVYDLWAEGKYMKTIMSYKKYYKAACAGIALISIYRLICKHPEKGREMLMRTNHLVRTLPIDRSSTTLMAPILDFTRAYRREEEADELPAAPKRQKYTRAVGETKKKYVASQQDWKCGHCSAKLTHTFEVDHVQRLDQGGSNDVSNLVALCRECHGNKTAHERMAGC